VASLGDLIVKVGGNIDGFRDAMNEGSSLAAGFGDKILELGLEVVGITSVFEGLKEAVEISAQIESVTVALAAFTGSAAQAAIALEAVEEIAQSGALSLTDAIPAAQHMMALGLSTESMAETMRAAADAAWALGLPVGDVTQRIAQIGLSGMVSERMLRTMGLSMSDLARVMGISKDDVKAAMEGMDEATRVAVMNMAIEQSKMAGTAAKESETISGQWTIFKNTFHSDFAEIGDDIKEITGFFLRFGTTVGQVLGDLFSNLPGVDPLKGMLEVIGSGLTSLREKGNLSGTKSFAEVSAEQHNAANRKQGPELPAGGSDASASAEDPHEAALKALKGKQAKEAAGPALAANTNADQAAVRSAELARKTAEIEIEAKHSAIVAENNLIADGFDRAKATSAEEIRLAEDKRTRIGAIDRQEHDARVNLLQQRESLEKAAKFEKDPTANAQKQIEVHAEVTGKIAALDGKLASEQIALDATVAKAAGKSNEDDATQLRQLVSHIGPEYEKLVALIRKQRRDAFVGENLPAAMSGAAGRASDEILAKGKGQTDAEAVQANKLAAERAYGEQVFHTFAQQIAYAQQLADFDSQARNAKIAGLQKELELTAAAMADASQGSEKQVADARRVAELFNEIALLQAKANNADFTAQTQIGIEKKKHQLGFEIKGDVKHAGEQIPGALGGSLAKGVFDGKNIGKDIANSLKGIGQQMLGNVFTKLIQTTLAHMAATLGLTAATTTNAGVTTVHSGVMLSHMGVMITHLGTMIVHGAIVLGNTIATVFNSAVTIILSTIEAIKAYFGFADGGVPPLGVPSIVGERGPELFIPHQLGTIIPNHQLRAFAQSGGAAGSVLSSSSSSVTGGNNTFNIHGATNPRETARAVANYLKTANPQFSPFAR
jgi:hypothetical protein